MGRGYLRPVKYLTSSVRPNRRFITFGRDASDMPEVFAQRIIGDGRITVPSHVREELGVGEGDYLRFTVEVLED